MSAAAPDESEVGDNMYGAPRLFAGGEAGGHERGWVVSVDTSVRPVWNRTGYKFFPYAAEHAGQWWVLRFNAGFPEHAMYTLFVDNEVAGDVTGSAESSVPLIASIGALDPLTRDKREPKLDPATARDVVEGVARFVDYGSERADPCVFCADDRDGLTREM